VTLNQSSGFISLGVTAHWPGWSVYGRYHGNFAGNWNDQLIEGGIGITF
jgi:hypothetical protein